MSRFEAHDPGPEQERLYLDLQEERVRVGSRVICRGEVLYRTHEVQAATVEAYSPGRNAGFLLLLVGASLLASAWIAPRAFIGVLGYEQVEAPALASWATWLGGFLVILTLGPLAFGRPKSFVLLETSRGRKVLLRTLRRELAERVAAAVNSAVDGRLRPSTLIEVGRDLTVGRDLNIASQLSVETILVDDAGPRSYGEPAEAAPSHRFPHLPRPALELQVREERSDGGAALRLGLVAVDATGETERRWFEPVRLKRDPRSLVDGWWKRLGGTGSAAAHYRELEGLGTELGAELLPRDLARLLTDQIGAERSLWLHSEEPLIPWELLRPPRTKDRESGSQPFLCASFAMTRWLGTRDPALVLPLRRIGVVVPETSETLAAAAELKFLLSLAGPGREILPLDPTIETITAALAGGELEGLHFCGHGLVHEQDPSLSAILLRRGEKLTPRALVGRLGSFAERKPLVFLNGCHTGRTGLTLTGMGGWAKCFVGAGAGAFIGCSWAVDGEMALRVAASFYHSFLGGSSLGEALRLSRLQSGLGDPLSPWAYTAYGHPLARVGGS